VTDGGSQAENPMVAVLKQELGGKVTEVTSPRARRIQLKATLESYRDIIKYLQEKQDCYHLSLINGVDLRTAFEVVYHFWSDKNGMFTMKVDIPRDKPDIGTITDIVPAAILYEREVHDLFGINFVGHPDMRRLVLSDDWPEGNYPLRKDWKMEEKVPYCIAKTRELKAARGGGKAA
jgi:NADH:ubiquinone oxidoreductase subunit C